MFGLDVIVQMGFIHEVLPTSLTSIVPFSRMNHIMDLQFVHVCELQIAPIALDIFEMTLNVTDDSVHRAAKSVSTVIASVDLPAAHILRNGIVGSPVLVRFVICIFGMHLLVQTQIACRVELHGTKITEVRFLLIMHL